MERGIRGAGAWGACVHPAGGGGDNNTSRPRESYRRARGARQDVRHGAFWGPKPELAKQIGREATAGCRVLPRGSALVHRRGYRDKYHDGSTPSS